MEHETEYPGIDYGRGKTNIDQVTGIRNGVISIQQVLQAWADDSAPDYGDPEEYSCTNCHRELQTKGCAWGETVLCDHCGEETELSIPDFAEPLAHTLEDEEYTAIQNQDDLDIFVTKSPYYTYCQFCSPCAPGAGYLMSPYKLPERYQETDQALKQCSPKTSGDLYRYLAEGAGFPKAYCFNHDWFDNGKAPYRVFRVDNNEEVLPEAS